MSTQQKVIRARVGVLELTNEAWLPSRLAFSPELRPPIQQAGS